MVLWEFHDKVLIVMHYSNWSDDNNSFIMEFHGKIMRKPVVLNNGHGGMAWWIFSPTIGNL